MKTIFPSLRENMQKQTHPLLLPSSPEKLILPAKRSKKFMQGYTERNNVKLVRAGKEYFDLLEKLIEHAKHTIHLQTYIYDDDDTGNRIAEKLIAAAKRNVSVYLMADGYASQSLSSHFINNLKANGVHFRYFEPIFKSKYFYFGRRLHHKVALFDSRYAIVGGINISNRYNDMPGKKAWLDFALYTKGEICVEICNRCWKTWEGFSTKGKSGHCENRTSIVSGQDTTAPMRMRINDWVRNKNEISRSYLEMFKNATSYITIVSSYFLPGRTFKKNIAEASKRGVKIKVVLAGHSDVKLAKHAERYIYGWLLKNNIEIYEYNENILHGKLAFYDDKWTTAGSYNVNNISAYASIELNLDVLDEFFTTSVRQNVETIIANDCTRITEEYFRSHTHFLARLWQKICSYIVRMLFYLFTFYFKQRRT